MRKCQLNNCIEEFFRKVYPSKSRVEIIKAIKTEVHGWKELEEDIEIKKAMEKMRKLYGHMSMREEKMKEAYGKDFPN